MKKLKRRFIMITMLSLSLVMLLLLGVINALIFYQTDKKANMTLQILSDNQGKFPEVEPGRKPPREPLFSGILNEETPFQTRYFIVVLNEDHSARMVDTGHISAVSSKDALDYAGRVLDGKKHSGYMGIYKYKLVDLSNGSMIIFMDCREQLQMMFYYLLTSLAVAFGTLLLVFILVSLLSRKAINPLIENMEKQKQFITDAGHEIKTPLAIISANADVLELTGGASEWIDSIRNQTVRLDRLVKNLLTLAKMEEENPRIVFSEFDLSASVYEMASSFTAMAEAQDKSLFFNIQPGLRLNGDVNLIGQLVSTLMDNALKYSNEKGEIKLSLFQGKKGPQLELFNTTDPIEVKNLDRLFDRFYRADASRSRETGGYGIGLSIARSIVEAHQGKISVHSEDGRSICFIVKFVE